MSEEINHPLHIAAEKNDVPEIKRLLAAGANVNVRGSNDATPLHVATRFNRVDSHYHTIELLLKNGADVNARTKKESTPLHSLPLYGDVKTVKLLLDYNADVNSQNRFKRIPLFNAICGKNFEVVKLLVDSGADVNYVGTGGYTSLYWSILYYRKDIFQLLFKMNVEVNSRLLVWTLRVCSINNEIANKLENPLMFLLKYSSFQSLNVAIPTEKLKMDASKNFWKFFLQHTAKLKALDLPINPSVFEFISKKKDSKDYFENCLVELELAKNTKLPHCWVTYFNMLVDNKIKLKNYAGNQDLVKGFENSDCLQKFPTYGASMKKKMEDGLKRRKRFDESSSILSYHLCIFNPSHLVIKGILDCLTLKDYNKILSIV